MGRPLPKPPVIERTLAIPREMQKSLQDLSDARRLALRLWGSWHEVEGVIRRTRPRQYFHRCPERTLTCAMRNEMAKRYCALMISSPPVE